MYSSDKLQEQSISLEAIRPTDRPIPRMECYLLVLRETARGISAPHPTTSHIGCMAITQNKMMSRSTMRVKSGRRKR
jgi:hypothetical protein